jgi:hypothetical protein
VLFEHDLRITENGTWCKGKVFPDSLSNIIYCVTLIPHPLEFSLRETAIADSTGQVKGKSLRRTDLYASFLGISKALHLMLADEQGYPQPPDF